MRTRQIQLKGKNDYNKQVEYNIEDKHVSSSSPDSSSLLIYHEVTPFERFDNIIVLNIETMHE